MYHNAAAKLGVPVEQLRRVMYYAEKRARYARHSDGRFLLKLENRTRRQIERLLKKQMNWLIAAIQTLSVFNQRGIRFVTKDIQGEIDETLDEMPFTDSIIDAMAAASSLALLRGSARTIQRHEPISEFRIDLQHEGAIQYLNNLQALHLSQRDGSISKTTEQNILQVIIDGLDKGDSYTKIANSIREQGNAGVFSKARAQTIAIDQITRAYSFGQKLQVDEFIQRTGARMSKMWSTVRDDKVSPDICAPNEQQGWILWDDVFQSGDSTVPGHINCRCEVITRIDSV